MQDPVDLKLRYPITYNALESKRRGDAASQPATTTNQPIHIRSQTWARPSSERFNVACDSRSSGFNDLPWK